MLEGWGGRSPSLVALPGFATICPTTITTLTRQQIIDTFAPGVTRSPAVHAAWLGGSDATGALTVILTWTVRPGRR
ncbi:MAG: hypothetical protein IPH82_30110 [Chloroflexi bacterium]|nr:hypothetical protein [Chloroflexota bacterium]